MSKSYHSNKVIFQESKIHGMAIFAKELVRKDEIFAIKMGSVLTKEKLKKLSDKLICTFLQIEDNYFVGAGSDDEYLDSMVGVNHSCEPNAGFMGNVVCVAMKDIQPGEEITYDYATFDTDLFGSFECNCGNKNCRKIITSDDWKNKDLQDKYGKYFNQYILNKIRE